MVKLLFSVDFPSKTNPMTYCLKVTRWWKTWFGILKTRQPFKSITPKEWCWSLLVPLFWVIIPISIWLWLKIEYPSIGLSEILEETRQMHCFIIIVQNTIAFWVNSPCSGPHWMVYSRCGGFLKWWYPYDFGTPHVPKSGVIPFSNDQLISGFFSSDLRGRNQASPWRP
jgi:hypothetical protein